jgi:MoxR-like ATPase
VTLTIDEVGARAAAVLDAVEQVVVGKRTVLEQVLMGMLCNGHVLIEDVPGVAKTMIARSMAQATGLEFSRIQFTPDMLPSDVTGSSVLRPDRTLEFRPGPIFAHVVLGDEINRTPPKTQAALLEAMAERQVTIDGETHVLDRPFVVLATQNPIDYEGTYALPEAQLDRFLLRISVGYPGRADEWGVLDRRRRRGTDDVTIAPVIDRAALVEMQDAMEQVQVSEALGYYIVDIVTATRTHPGVELGASPRGSLAMLLASRARAALSGRDFVTPEDVKAVALPALFHRLTLRPELWVQGARVDQVVQECLDGVPVPVDDAASSGGPR